MKRKKCRCIRAGRAREKRRKARICARNGIEVEVRDVRWPDDDEKWLAGWLVDVDVSAMQKPERSMGSPFFFGSGATMKLTGSVVTLQLKPISFRMKQITCHRIERLK